ncbi:MAG: hypothetical protein HKP30_09210, partial [Myxococcales bacterium]|nr:hypothetical protein [Myxococcales bacterium]
MVSESDDGSGAERARRRRRTLLRYLAFQLPEWSLVLLLLLAIRGYTEAPGWVLWACGAGFVAKDLALYPWLR